MLAAFWPVAIVPIESCNFHKHRVVICVDNGKSARVPFCLWSVATPSMPAFLPLASDVSLYGEDTYKARMEPRRVSGIYAAPSGRQAMSFCLLFFLYFFFLFLFRASGSPDWRGFPRPILTNFQLHLTNFQLHLTNFQVYLTNFQLTRP
jgi:hypothetical protein